MLLKKYSEKGSNELALLPSSGEHDFWAEFGSRAKIDRGAPGAPPPPDGPTQTSHWLGLSTSKKAKNL